MTTKPKGFGDGLLSRIQEKFQNESLVVAMNFLGCGILRDSFGASDPKITSDTLDIMWLCDFQDELGVYTCALACGSGQCGVHSEAS